MPMIRIGSHRLPEVILIGPIASALRDQHDRQRDREQVDRKRPENIEQARQDEIDDSAEEAGDDAHQRRKHEADRGRRGADQQRIAAAVEQSGGDVAALAVGSQHVGSEAPGRLHRREAQAQPFGRGLHDLHGLAGDDDLAVEVGAERVGAGDLASHRPAPAGRRARSAGGRARPPWRRGHGAACVRRPPRDPAPAGPGAGRGRPRPADPRSEPPPVRGSTSPRIGRS